MQVIVAIVDVLSGNEIDIDVKNNKIAAQVCALVKGWGQRSGISGVPFAGSTKSTSSSLWPSVNLSLTASVSLGCSSLG